ncbi:immunoglobulin alpha-2 heavy chain-like [Gopherus flavomarginatus]|uniref:immunoglobulin alpha-2 heavy chain-like n=1 Tax=Gopherus flavomarginatus TaxID=286002 RepID=UPI0021CBE507|nr:immunoglobulin alpha-2 heavy chain-like [Gopherus flavomarginatus]
MDSLLLPLLLLALAPGVRSQLRLQESGPGVLKPGETLTLTCAVTGGTVTEGDTVTRWGTVTSSRYWNWIHQAPGHGLEWMGYWSGSTSYAPSLQGRITISVNSSNAKYYLRLSSLTAANTGIYYCTRDTVTQGKAGTIQKEGADFKQSSVLFQVQLVQTDPGTVKPGEILSITCKVSGISISSYYWSWAHLPREGSRHQRSKHVPGAQLLDHTGAQEGLEWLAAFYDEANSKCYTSSVRGRFTASKDSTNFYLVT